MRAAANAQRPFTGWHMLAITVSFFAVIIAVNITLAWLANATWSGLVVENSYVASQTFNRDAARNRAQAERGWTVEFSHAAESVSIRIADRDGRPLAGMALAAELRRPATQSQDQELRFDETQAGLYLAGAKLAPGLWELALSGSGAAAPAAADGTPGYAKMFRFVVQP